MKHEPIVSGDVFIIATRLRFKRLVIYATEHLFVNILIFNIDKGILGI